MTGMRKIEGVFLMLDQAISVFLMDDEIQVGEELPCVRA